MQSATTAIQRTHGAADSVTYRLLQDFCSQLPGFSRNDYLVAGLFDSNLVTHQPTAMVAQVDITFPRISQGDQGAFDALLAEHGAAIFSFLQRRVRPRETAEDLFQDTWIRVINSAHTFRNECPVRPWLYRIALNVVNDHFRREGAARRGGGLTQVELDAAAEVPAQVENTVELTQQNQLLHRAVEQLPEPFREVVRLRYFEELGTEDVARVLECAAGTVKSRLSRGLMLLEQQLEELR